ncbi:hypothetical protein R1sor_004151 [Riccia sorocarpa]|uniref:DDE Tnp4 domain-containing protein n=1 Tax=Riccia sorocarpa TaxID=122646 RepID=A0ABD3H6H5_9MARC
MVNYTGRVMIALRDKLRDHVSWPTASERRRITTAFAEKGFPGCVGLIDGTLIPLSQRPHDGGQVYYDRKNRYSYNVQIINDDRRRILFCFAGEYLIGDSGYTPLPRLVPAFRFSTRDKDNLTLVWHIPE